jgi:hypothetical protein
MKIHVEGMDAVSAQVKEAIGVGFERGMEVAGARGAQLVQQNISSPYLGRTAAVSTGELLHSITYEVSRAATLSRVVIFSQPPGGDYAAYVETGTGPHFPPIAPLLLWVSRRLGVKDEKQALSIAFAIAKTIAKRGVSGFGMFARAMAVLQGELQGIFEEAIGAAIEEAGLAK